MKALKFVMSVLAVLAAIAGVVFVVVRYGDKIVEWMKRMWARLNGLCDCCCDEDCCCCCDEDCCCEEECCCEEAEAPAEEVTATEGDFAE